jgi:hypothetical protein
MFDVGRSMLIVRLLRIQCSLVSLSMRLASGDTDPPPAEHLKPMPSEKVSPRPIMSKKSAVFMVFYEV